MDLNGDVSGLLSAHPQAPLLSFHHLDHIDPIFPSMTRIQSLQHLFKAENADSSRLLQQNVCYDKSKNWSLSISWGYSFHIYESILPPSLLQRPIQTFGAWKNTIRPPFMFNTRPLSSDPCEAPHWFFFESIEETAGGSDMIVTKYVRRSPKVLGTCAISGNHSAEPVSQILVLSPRKRLDWVGRYTLCISTLFFVSLLFCVYILI